MKKIALVSSGDLPIPAVKGGAVETLLELLVEQNEVENKVHFIVVSCNNEKAKEKSKKYANSTFLYIKKNNFIEDKVSKVTYLMNKLSKLFLHNEIPTYSGYYRRALKKLLKENPDFVVFEGGPRPTGFFCFTKYFNRDQLVIHLHGNWFPSKFISNMFGRVISVSKFIEDEYLSTCSNKEVKAFTVYNTVNQKALKTQVTKNERNELRQKLSFSDDDIIVVFCGRICADKGVLELIKAIKLCDDRVKLLIIGSPHFAEKEHSKYLNDVKKIVNESPEKIVFTGFIPNKDVYKYYKISDIHCISSTWEEPGALVNIEGMTTGLPMIVTKSGGNSEYVSPKCALLIDKGIDLISNLKSAITLLENDSQKRFEMSKKSLERSELFSNLNFYISYLRSFE